MTSFTFVDYVFLAILLLGGIVAIVEGLRMLDREDTQESLDNLCPPHKWAYQERGDVLRCVKCRRTPSDVPPGPRDWPPSF